MDARNHGNSGQVSQMDYHLMSRDALEFCKEHSLEKVSLIGDMPIIIYGDLTQLW